MTLSIIFPDDERREMMVLSRWARACLSKGDRLKDEALIGSTIGAISGLVRSEADLKPEGEALCGPDYVFQGANMQPDRMAMEHLSRTEHDGSEVLLVNARAILIVAKMPDVERPGTSKEVEVFRAKINETGRVEEELAHVRRHHPEWSAESRVVQGGSALTGEEKLAVSHLKYLFEKTLRSMADRGWVALEPTLRFTSVGPEGLPGGDENYKTGDDDRGGIFWARVLPAGLDEAMRRCAGDPYWGNVGAFSSLEGASPDVRAAAVQESPWAQQRYAEGT